MTDSVMVDGGASAIAGGTGVGPGIEGGEGVVSDNVTLDKVVRRKKRSGAKERFNGTNGVFSRPKSEYISPCECMVTPYVVV